MKKTRFKDRQVAFSLQSRPEMQFKGGAGPVNRTCLYQ